MVLTSWIATFASILWIFVVYKYISTKGNEKQWGGALKGFRLEQAHKALVACRDFRFRPKDWRPQLLLCVDTEAGEVLQPGIVRMGAQLRKGKGLTVMASIIPNDSAFVTKELHQKAWDTKKVSTITLVICV